MTHHIGAFILNTIKPLIEELDKLLGKCKHLKLGKEDIEQMLFKVIWLELNKVRWYCLTYLALGVMLCLTMYFILG